MRRRCVHKLNRTTFDVNEHKRASQLVCGEYELRQDDSQPLQADASVQALFQRLFDDSIDLFGSAYWEMFRDAKIMSKSGADQADALRKNLKDVLVMLMECRCWGDEWVEHAVGNLINSLLALSECLIEVACHCFYTDKEVQSKKDKLKPNKEKEKPVVAPLHLHAQLARALLSNSKDPETQLFSFLTSVAAQRASEAVELHNHGSKAGLDFLNQGNNTIFLCCTLAFSFLNFGFMIESRPGQTLHYSNPTKIAAHDQDFKKFMADLECLAKERPALYRGRISFSQKMHTKWTAGMREWHDKHTSANMVDCIVSQEKFKDEAKDAQHMWHEAMRCLCIQYPLAQHDKDVAFSFQDLFQDTIDSLGRASWEFLQVMNTPRKQEVILEAEAAMKALMNCQKDQSGWKEKYRDTLAVRLRRLSEALLKAACRLLDPAPPLTMMELLRERRPDQVRWIATLCNAANNIASSIEIHHEKGAEQKSLYENLDNNVAMVCHCTAYAIMWYASLVRAGPSLRNVDANSENQSFYKEYLRCLKESIKRWLGTSSGAYPGSSWGLRRRSFGREKLESMQKAEANEVVLDAFLEECKALTNAYKFAMRQVESNDHGLIDTFNTEGVWAGQALEHVQWSQLVTEMHDMKTALQRYQHDFSASTWLHRLISKDEERHHNYILEKSENALKQLQGKDDFKLRGLQEKIENFCQERKELMESNNRAREQLDLWEHIRDLRQIVAEISEGHKTESQSKDEGRTWQALQQAAAYWQAINDEDGKHHAIDHPDLLVLWHRVGALKERLAAELDIFWESFPSRLVVPQDYREEIRTALRKCRKLLEQHLERSGPEAGSLQDSGIGWVTTESINLVFQWNEIRRLGVLEAIQECQKKASSPPSSEFSGPGTPSIQDEVANPSSLSEGGHSNGEFASSNLESTDFIGRAHDLERVIATMTKAKHHVLLTGPGGIGKSTLGGRAMAVLASQYQAYTVDLFSADSEEGVLDCFASKLRLVGKAEATEDERAKIVRHFQKLANKYKSSRKGIILLLDSCEIPLSNQGASQTLMELLEHVAKRAPQVLMLVAVRTSDKADGNKHLLRRLLDSKICLFEEAAIRPLDLDAAKHLILREGFRAVDPGEHDEEAKELAEMCGCIPLRLRLAASVLSAGRVRFEDIKAALNAEANTTLEQALLVWHADVHLHALFRLSLFLASFSTEQALYMLDDFDYREQLLQELYSRHLIMAKAESGKLAWGLHSDVRAAIQKFASKEGWHEREHAASIMFAECMMAELSESARAASRSQLGLASSIALTQQSSICAALGVAEHSEEVCATVSQALLQQWHLFESGHWLNCIGRVAALLMPSMQQLTQAWRDAVQEAAVDQAANGEGSAEQGSGSMRNGAGGAANHDDGIDWGKWMSENVSLEHGGGEPPRLEFLEATTLPKKQRMLAHVLWMFGYIVDHQGKWGEAEVMLREVLELRKKLLGPEHPNTLTSMSNLANALKSQGKWGEAEVMHREVLELRKVVGPEHPDTLISMNNLAAALDSQGKWGEAEVMHREVLELRKKVLGPEHPGTLTSMNDLANALDSQGKWGEAEVMHREVLELRKKVLGPENPGTLISMNNLANALDSQGKGGEAEVMHREVLELNMKVLGPEHPDTLTSMNNLAAALDSQGKWGEAEVMHREVLELMKKVLGPEHPGTLTSMNNLASALKSQGKWDEAEVMHREKLELSKKVLGPEHPDTLTSMNNLAVALGSQGKRRETVRILQDTVPSSCRVQGAEHPHTVRFCRSLKMCLWNWAHHSSKLVAPDVPVFLNAALLTTQWPLDHERLLPWPDHVASWCKLLAASGAKKQAHILAAQAAEQCRDKLGGSHGDTKACKRLQKRYS